jgi:hypothetical protein
VSETTRFPVQVGAARYVVAPDDSVPPGVRTGAIVKARLVDELTGKPVSLPITVEPAGTAFDNARTRAGVNPRAAEGGVVGLVGVPTRALPLLGLNVYEIGVTVHASGYLSRTEMQNVGPVPLFPGVYAPTDLGDLAMHRTPVQLVGRAVLRGAAGDTPLPAVTVRIGGIWRTAPTLTVSPPASPPDLVAIDAPLYTARSVGASLRMVALTPDLVNPKRLEQPAVAGATTVELSDRVAIAAPNVLGIDVADPDRAEWVVIKSIVGATSAALPATVTLEHPLARTHAAGAPAHGITVGGPTTSRALGVAAIRGDTTLFTTALGALAPGTVEVDDGVAPPEYHRLARYETTSDADGQWRLPPLARVAQLTVVATHAVNTTPVRTVTPEYPRREQRLDLPFK